MDEAPTRLSSTQAKSVMLNGICNVSLAASVITVVFNFSWNLDILCRRRGEAQLGHYDYGLHMEVELERKLRLTRKIVIMNDIGRDAEPGHLR